MKNGILEQYDVDKIIESITGLSNILPSDASPEEIEKRAETSPLIHGQLVYLRNRDIAKSNRWKNREWTPKRIRECFQDVREKHPNNPVREISGIMANMLQREGIPLSVETIRRYTRDLRKKVTTQEGFRGGTPPEGSWRLGLPLPVG